MIEEELVDACIFAPREENRNERHGQQPPALRPLHDQESEHEKEADDGPDIHRPAREGLIAPVHRGEACKLAPLIRLPVIGKEAVRVRVGADVMMRIRAVEVGDEQRHGLAPAVAPHVGIVDLEPRAFFLTLRIVLQHRPPAHGFLHIVG